MILKPFRSLRRRTLKGTLNLLLLIVLVPVLMVQAGIYWSWYRSQRQRELEANLEVARAVAATLDAYVQDVVRQERAIGLAFESLRPMKTEQMNGFLRVVAGRYPSLRNINWISPQGRVLASSDVTAIGMDARDRAYFQEILAGKDWMVADLVLSKITGGPVAVLSWGSRDPGGKLLGIVAAYLDPDRLGEVLQIKRARGSGLIITDRAGKIAFRYPQVPMTWEQRDWLKDFWAIRQSLVGKEAATVAVSGFDGKRRIVANVPIPSIGWVAAAAREEDAVLGPVWRSFVRDSLLFLCVAALALAGAGLTGRLLAGNLRRLRDQAASVGSGELEREVQVGGPEEFVQLAESFNRMAAALRVRDEEKGRLAAAERQALEQAAAAYERAHQVLESIGEAFFSVDSRWQFTYINREAERLWRRRREDMLGRPTQNFFPEQREKVFYEHFRTALESQLPAAFEAPSGPAARWTEVRIYPVEGELWVYFRDINDRKQAEEERRRLQHQLFEARRMESVGYLAAGIAHDFNNLLMIMVGNTELALSALPEGASARRQLTEIGRATDRAAELTSQMLAYAGEGPSSLERVDLSRVVSEVAEDLEPSIPKNALLQRDLATNLPRVEADPSQLGKVIASLIANAAEAIGEREGIISLRTGEVAANQVAQLGGRSEGELPETRCVYLEVTDTGSGMDEETRERIFDPFFSTKFAGRGLGLAAALGIVRTHNGVISVSSEPGKGAIFTVLLPVAGRTRDSARQTGN